MKKLIGISLFLALLYGLLLYADPNAGSYRNQFDLGQQIGLFSVLSLGAGMVIISGGIDLSIGSVVGLCTTLLAMLLMEAELDPLSACLIILALGAVIGLFHGLLVTKLGLQPFVVTLCGLFIYRGAAIWISGQQNKGLATEFRELKLFFTERGGLPPFLIYSLLLAAMVMVFLHQSIYGRYLFAIGSNERAARYSGVKTDRMKILAFVLCSMFAAWFSFLYLMQYNSAQPSDTGSYYELYAIAGAVLGGCSLRGGEGNVLGILIGTCFIPILLNSITMWGIPSKAEFMIIGIALLFGATMDEMVRRPAARVFFQKGRMMFGRIIGRGKRQDS